MTTTQPLFKAGTTVAGSISTAVLSQSNLNSQLPSAVGSQSTLPGMAPQTTLPAVLSETSSTDRDPHHSISLSPVTDSDGPTPSVEHQQSSGETFMKYECT